MSDQNPQPETDPTAEIPLNPDPAPTGAPWTPPTGSQAPPRGADGSPVGPPPGPGGFGPPPVGYPQHPGYPPPPGAGGYPPPTFDPYAPQPPTVGPGSPGGQPPGTRSRAAIWWTSGAVAAVLVVGLVIWAGVALSNAVKGPTRPTTVVNSPRTFTPAPSTSTTTPALPKGSPSTPPGKLPLPSAATTDIPLPTIRPSAPINGSPPKALPAHPKQARFEVVATNSSNVSVSMGSTEDPSDDLTADDVATPYSAVAPLPTPSHYLFLEVDAADPMATVECRVYLDDALVRTTSGIGRCVLSVDLTDL